MGRDKWLCLLMYDFVNKDMPEYYYRRELFPMSCESNPNNSHRSILNIEILLVPKTEGYEDLVS